MPERYRISRLGRLPSPRSIWDYTPEHPKVKGAVKALLGEATNTIELPKIDFTRIFTKIRDQLDLGSCVAFAWTGANEAYYKKKYKSEIHMSPLFLYKIARHMLGWTGDTGLYIKSGASALAHYGVPKEVDYEYYPPDYEKMPTWDIGQLASNYQIQTYFRLDSYPYSNPESILTRVKTYLQKEVPVVFGFNCYESLWDSDETGEISFPKPGEQLIGGHAIVMAGYDNGKVIDEDVGAFKIRNSWGTGWGESGYGWLPYRYLLEGQADEFWVATKMEWLDALKTE